MNAYTYIKNAFLITNNHVFHRQNDDSRTQNLKKLCICVLVRLNMVYQSLVVMNRKKMLKT